MTIIYELRKMLVKRKGWIIILIALILKIIMLMFYPQETYVNAKMEENKAQFNSYIEALFGVLTDQKEQYIADEMASFTDIEVQNECIMNSYISGDIGELNFVEHIKEYNLAMEKKEAFSIVQGQYQAALQNEKCWFAYYNGLTFLFSQSTQDWLLIILILLFAVPVVTSEYSCGMAYLLNTTYKGKSNLNFSKYMALMIITLALTVIFSLAELIYAANKYGLSGINCPIQTIPQFTSSEYDISLFDGLIFIWLNKLLGMHLLAAIVFFTACKSKKPLPALFVGISSILLPSLLLRKSKLMYELPLPVGMFNAVGFLRSRFETSYMSGQYISLSQTLYLRTVIISIGVLLMFSVFSIIRLKFSKGKCFAILCCTVFTLSGCEKKPDTSSDVIYNKHGAYEIIDNSRYIFQNDDNKLLMIDKHTDEQINIIRDPFIDNTTTILYSSMFADRKYFYRCEQKHSLSLNRHTILMEQIVRTDLDDFSEDVIYTNIVLEDMSGEYLGLGEYLPAEASEENSIRSFIVIDKSLFLEMADGIYYCNTEGKKPKKLTDEPILTGEWSYSNNMLYYIDNLYRLHCLEILSGDDVVISDKRVSALFLTKDSIYIRSLSDGGALMKLSPSYDKYEVIAMKAGNCFAVDNNSIYYTDAQNGGVLCKIDIPSSKQTTVSESICSFVYPISNCDYFYYRAFDTKSQESILLKG